MRRITQTLGPLPFVLVANKADRQAEWEIDPSRLEALTRHGWRVVTTITQKSPTVLSSLSVAANWVTVLAS